MPKFQINASFSLTTEVEPEGLNLAHSFNWEDAEDVDDTSYLRGVEVESDGGEVTFKVEATDEYEAESKAGGFISDGMEIEDDNGLTWLITNVSFDIEEIEAEMTVERAKEIIKTWLTAVPKTGLDGDLIPSEVREALLFLLDRVS